MQSLLKNDREDVRRERQIALLLGLDLALVGLVCFAQVRGSIPVLAMLMAAFLALAVLAAERRMTIPFFLFFLPWSPLLKLYQGSISFYTVAILIACAIHFVRGGCRMQPYQIFCAAGFMIITLLSKAIHGYSLSMSYLFFVVMLLIFPVMTDRAAHDCTFFQITLFFAVGIISSALIARQIAGYPRISQFIKVDSYLTITRLSGFYDDPNFYSSHITTCFAGIQLLLVKERSRIERVILSVLAVALIYCGLLSASKSFVIVLACQSFVWVLLLTQSGNSGSIRVRVMLGVLAAAVIMLSSSSVEDLLRVLDTRFSYAANMSQITTGRTELWKTYLNEFTHDPVMLLIGVGFTPVNINGRASHSTLLQGIFQLGLIGFPIFITWQILTIRRMLRDAFALHISKTAALLMAAGALLPWFALDYLFFDELFIFPIYIVLGCIYYSEKTDGSIPPHTVGRADGSPRNLRGKRRESLSF